MLIKTLTNRYTRDYQGHQVHPMQLDIMCQLIKRRCTNLQTSINENHITLLGNPWRAWEADKRNMWAFTLINRMHGVIDVMTARVLDDMKAALRNKHDH